MGLFGKSDPISEREKALNEEIAALEAKIKRLSEEAAEPRPLPQALARDPIFEQVASPKVLNPDPTPQPKPTGNLKELGVRSFEKPGLIDWIKGIFKPRPPANPQLVNYLAAGSLQGFRPLRYEKRVARNRFIALTVVLLLLIWGILAALVRW